MMGARQASIGVIAGVLSLALEGAAEERAPAGALPAARPSGIVRVRLGELDGSPAVGPEKARVTLVAFMDYECPFCARAHATLEELRESYPEDVRIVYKHNPLAAHPAAEVAAQASMAAMALGEFPRMHALMLAHQKELDAKGLARIASEAGMDPAAFTELLESGDFASDVAKDKDLAKRIGVSSTPFFFVNGRPVRGAQPFSVFKSFIDQELSESVPASQWVDRLPPPGPRAERADGGGAVERDPLSGELDGIVPATANEAVLTRHVAKLKEEVDALRSEVAQLRRSLGTLAALQRAQRDAGQPEAESIPVQADRISMEGDPFLGKEDAPIGIVVFADYGCPYSRKLARHVLPALRERYIDTGKVRYVYRDRPAEGREPNLKAALAANCAGRQGAYWKMHDALYALETGLDSLDYGAMAMKLGLDALSFAACMGDPGERQEIESDVKDSEGLNIRVAPTLFVGRIEGQEIVGARRISGVHAVRTLTRIIDRSIDS